jgi:hypothetical protein
MPPLWLAQDGPDGVRTMSPGQAHHFHPFAETRPDGAVRIGVLGGSAAHGYGMLEPGAFPHRLEQLLQLRLPDRQIEVINLGTVAWSTQQLLWASKQLWDNGPWDLLILYSGNNELLELSSWKSFMPPAEHRRYTRTLLWNQRLGGLRIYSILHRLVTDEKVHALQPTWLDPQAHPPPRPEEIVGGDEERGNLHPGQDPIGAPHIPAQHLDEMTAVPREQRARMGEPELRYGARTYTHNVRRIAALARDHGAPLLVMNPAPNDWQDPAYFPWGGDDGAEFNKWLEDAAKAFEAGDAVRFSELVAKARAARPTDPLALYHDAQGNVGRNPERAGELFALARQYAEYPNRVVPQVSEAIRAMEGRPGVAGVIDIEAVFRAASEDGIIGYDLIYDHCHPSLEANYIIAGEIARWLDSAGLPWMAGAVDVDVDAWVAAGREAMRSRQQPDPRLGEWTGHDWAGTYGWGDGQRYIADFQGQWQELRELLVAPVKADAPTPMQRVWAGNALWYDYQLGEALWQWERALTDDPDTCVAAGNLAHAWASVGAFAKARPWAEAAAACDPDSPDWQRLARRMAVLTKDP